MLFELGKSFGSLAQSPMSWALQEAHRMARRPLDAGGNVTPDGGTGDQDLVLPPDVGAAEVARAIEDWLRGQRFSSGRRGHEAGPSLQTNADGKVVLPAELMVLVGDGSADRGRRVLERIVSELRQRRMLSRLPIRPLQTRR